MYSKSNCADIFMLVWRERLSCFPLSFFFYKSKYVDMLKLVHKKQKENQCKRTSVLLFRSSFCVSMLKILSLQTSHSDIFDVIANFQKVSLVHGLGWGWSGSTCQGLSSERMWRYDGSMKKIRDSFKVEKI